MPNWFDGQNVQGWQPQGQPGAEVGAAMPSQGAPAGGGSPFSLDAFTKRAQELSAGSSGTNAEFQQRIYPQLAQEFGGLERFGSKGDKIRLPNGEVIDAVISAGLGGKGYNWGVEKAGGGQARPPMRPPIGGGNVSPGLSGAPQPAGGEGPNGLDTNDPQAMAEWRARYPGAESGAPPAAYAGPERVAGPMSDGPGPQSQPQGPNQPFQQSGDYQSTPIGDPTAYTPQNVQGPSAWNGQPVSASTVGQGQQVQYQGVNPAGPLARAGDISAATVAAPERVRGPQAIQAERLAAATPFQGTTANDVYQDPSYKLRLNTSLEALQQATARNGTLRSTNTYQALTDRAGQMASEEFAATDARRARDYATNEGNRQAITNANNQSALSAYGMSNQFDQAAQLANQRAGIDVGTFNAAQQNQIAATNAGRSDTMNLAEWQQQNDTARFNASNQLSTDTFNAGNQQQRDLFNAGAQNTAAGQNSAQSLAAWQQYQGMNQQAGQFNAARTDTAAQQNWSNQFNTTNANNANSLAAWQANVGAKNAAGQLALGNKQADQSYALGNRNVDLGYTQAGNTLTLGMGNLALGNKSADQSYDLGLRNNELGWFNGGNSYDLGQQGNALGWANYGLNQSGQDWNQTFALANMGYGAATQAGGWAGDYGGASGGYAAGAANAAAGGKVGAANAWNQGLGGAANSAIGAYGAYQGGKAPAGGQVAQWTGPGPAPWQTPTQTKVPGMVY